MNELLRATRSADLSYYADMTHILYQTSEADPGFLAALCIKNFKTVENVNHKISELLIPYLRFTELVSLGLFYIIASHETTLN